MKQTLLAIVFGALVLCAARADEVECLGRIKQLHELAASFPTRDASVVKRFQETAELLLKDPDFAKVADDAALPKDLRFALGQLAYGPLYVRELAPRLKRAVQRGTEIVKATGAGRREVAADASPNVNADENPNANGSRLGETFEQCERRYGKAEGGVDAKGIATFWKNGFRMYVYFFNGMSERIIYSKTGKDDVSIPAALTPEEVEALLHLHAGSWTKVGQDYDGPKYSAENGSKLASYMAKNHLLILYTPEANRHLLERAENGGRKDDKSRAAEAQDRVKGL